MGASQSTHENKLYEACMRGDVRAIAALLGKGVDPNAARGPNTWSALHAAAYHGPAEVVNLLLDAGADINALNDDSHSPLYVAIASHQFPCAEALILRSARVVGDAGPLWTKCFTLSSTQPQGKPELAELLLAGGADPNAPNADGIPPLSEAIGRGMIDLALVILSCPDTNVALPDADGITPLHYAAYAGSVELGHSLLSRGAPVAAAVSDGATPAFFAAEEGHAAFLGMLLASSPSTIAQRNAAEWTLLHVAANTGADKVVDTLLKIGLASSAEVSLDIDARTEHGTTPLAVAASKGFVAICAKLLDAGADVNALTDTHASALHKAALGGHVQVGKVLLRRGVAIDTANVDGWSALHVAAHENHPDFTALLISHGAALELESTTGLTPLDVALRSDAHAAAHALLDHAAPIRDHAFLASELASANHLDPSSARAGVLQRAADACAGDLLPPSADAAPTQTSDAPAPEPGSLAARKAGSRRKRRTKSMMTDDQRRTLLFLKAARHGSVARLNALESAADVAPLLTATSKAGLSPLFLAISHGHDSATAWLLARGATLNGTPAERAAEAKATGGATFLHRAIVRGEDARVELLLEAYTDVDVRDGDGNTPAHIAAYMNNMAYLALLGASGRADLAALNHAGQTPLARALNSLDTFRFLVLNAPDTLNVGDVAGLTPVAALAAAGDVEKLRFAIAAGGDATTRDAAGYTPLHHVAVHAPRSHAALDVPLDVDSDTSAATAAVLLDAGADVDATASSDGAWPLLLAVSAQAGPLVKFLIAAGADLSKTTVSGRTAYDTALATNLAVAAIVEAGLRKHGLARSPPRKKPTGHAATIAATQDLMLEFAAYKARTAALEAENTRLRAEMRQLRKLVLRGGATNITKIVVPGTQGDLDATIRDLSRKGGFSRKRRRIRKRRRRPMGSAAASTTNSTANNSIETASVSADDDDATA
ncbi:ankyrin domain-containing protein [Thecamonas trahens ATCC 50062]|uniref:Ankyrin domain-containing protein n=1 Tax=Thecamonas trahens ATCC 50062 TaxID=461836 RepID=A0A0L0D6U2_THETB|nr:ankyrin domain-containing protein [Thecamonas trahens ATCC 50062]KNC47028.1 ankyrin domain-containing protein [Thecamonas trahens ATCC 50062]|eukprot:XP_013759808.1 ankyrin domain-containing protein [Thecamonas trahens ATCC 50062]